MKINVNISTEKIIYFFSKNKRDIYFLIIGLILTACLGYFFIESVYYFTSNVENALDVGVSSYNPVLFNINGLKTLGIFSQEKKSLEDELKNEATSSSNTTPQEPPAVLP
jgi:hypothetical protein